MNNEQKLRNVLRGNAIFSTLSGLSLAIFYQPIAQWMKVNNSKILLYIGIGLVLFATTLFLTANKKVIDKTKIKFIIYQDWAWVIGSAVILALQLFSLTHMAYWLIADVAIIVGVFAFLQMRYLKQL